MLALDDRQRGGRVVLEFPNVQRAVGEMSVALQASQAIVVGLAVMKLHGGKGAQELLLIQLGGARGEGDQATARHRLTARLAGDVSQVGR